MGPGTVLNFVRFILCNLSPVSYSCLTSVEAAEVQREVTYVVPCDR